MNNRRYMVYTKSGRKFMVEEYGHSHTDWGNLNPATKKIEHVYSKDSEVIDDSNTQILPSVHKNIVMLDKGTSPMAYIEVLDSSGLERFEEISFGKYL